MGKNFTSARTTVDDGKKWEDELPLEIVDIRDIAKNELKPIRLVGFIEPFMRFWVPTDAKNAYDPYKTRTKQYPAVCTDFDAETEEFSGNECLYRKAHYQYVDDKSGEKKWGRLKPTKNYLIFFIDREAQEERTGIPLEKKVKQAKKFSDIKCATVPLAFVRGVQSAIEMFTKKNGKAVDPTDPENGFDIFFKFDAAADAASKYSVQLGDSTPLTKNELRQLRTLPESINIYPKDNPTKIAASLDRHGYIIVEKGEDPDEVLAAGSSKKPARSVMKAGAEMLSDDDDEADKPAAESFEDEENDLGLEDEEVKTKKKKKTKPVEVVEEVADEDDEADAADDDDEFDWDDDLDD